MDCRQFTEEQLLQKLESEFDVVINDSSEIYKHLSEMREYNKLVRLFRDKTNTLFQLYSKLWQEYFHYASK